MNINEMTNEELIYEAERIRYGDSLTEYMSMYKEMLKRLKKVIQWTVKNVDIKY